MCVWVEGGESARRGRQGGGGKEERETGEGQGEEEGRKTFSAAAAFFSPASGMPSISSGLVSQKYLMHSPSGDAFGSDSGASRVDIPR